MVIDLYEQTRKRIQAVRDQMDNLQQKLDHATHVYEQECRSYNDKYRRLCEEEEAFEIGYHLVWSKR